MIKENILRPVAKTEEVLKSGEHVFSKGVRGIIKATRVVRQDIQNLNIEIRYFLNLHFVLFFSFFF